MKFPFVEKVIARDNDRILVKVKKNIENEFKNNYLTKYEIWHNVAKYELGIASEMMNNAYYVYMITIDAPNETSAIDIFFSMK